MLTLSAPVIAVIDIQRRRRQQRREMDSQLFIGKPQLRCHEPLLTDLPGSDPKAYQNFLRRVLLNFLRWCYRISLIRRHQLEESWGPYIYERSPTAVARATDIRDLS